MPEEGVPAALSNVATLRQYLGTYETANGGKFDVVLRPDGTLAIQYASGTFQNLLRWQPARLRIEEFPDVVFEFVTANGKVSALRQLDPSGEYRFAEIASGTLTDANVTNLTRLLRTC